MFHHNFPPLTVSVVLIAALVSGNGCEKPGQPSVAVTEEPPLPFQAETPREAATVAEPPPEPELSPQAMEELQQQFYGEMARTTKVEPDDRIVITALELAQEFSLDEAAANRRFMGQEIEMSGSVGIVGMFYSGGGYIYLDGTKWQTETDQPWAKVLPGQHVRVTGKFEPGIRLKIIEVTGHRLTMTAERLATDYGDDRELTHRKFQDRWMEVRGEVIKTETNSAGAVTVHLQGTEDTIVDCRFPALGEERFAMKLKPGDNVRVVGQYDKLHSSDLMSNAHPVLLFCLGISEVP